MSDIAIRAKGLGKRYRIGAAAARHDSFRQAIAHAATAPFRNMRRLRGLGNATTGTEYDSIWALQDVSFEVRHGEVLGIIGRNGAGKSTLLKILSRITDPTRGRVEIHGRVGALLEVGTGFHPELTGRDNIYLNGSILGMDRAYIDHKFDEIVEFSGVEKFIDTPVKRYSSGMYLRLAFSVAAHLEPEILVVDEVLAVGDAEFQRKCLGRMGEVARQGRTVLFVSHNMAAIEALCSRCLVLASGTVAVDATPHDSIRAYLYQAERRTGTDLLSVSERRGSGRVRFARMELFDSAGDPASMPASGEDLEFRLSFGFTDNESSPVRARIGIAIATALGQSLVICSTEMTHAGAFWLHPEQPASCTVRRLPLSGGRYAVTLFLETDGVIQDWLDGIELDVEDADYFGFGKNCPAGWDGKCVLVDHEWSRHGA